MSFKGKDLDPLQREVILFRDIQELTAPEAAAQLGISIDALKSRLHRARVITCSATASCADRRYGMTDSNEIDLSKLTRIGQGRTAEVFALDEVRVIKVARDGAAAASLDREATAMRAAHSANMPVPAAHALVDVGGRRALIMDRARGVDMLTQFARRPWTIIRAGAKLGRLHAKLHETVAPSELPSLKQMLLDRIAGSVHVPDAVRDRVLPILRELPDGERLCHLDFHPANVIADGATMTVIDWPGACRGDPLADVAMTTITLQGGKTTPGTPWITRLLAPVGRRLLLGGYARSYRKHGSFDRERFAKWFVVAAAQRLTYDVDGEQAMLLRVIERAP